MIRLNKTIMRVLVLVLAIISFVTLITNRMVDATLVEESANLTPVKSKGNKVSNISELSHLIKSNIQAFFNGDVVYQLPSEVKDNDTISVIVSMNQKSLYDEYQDTDRNMTFSEFVSSEEGQRISNNIYTQINKKVRELNKKGIAFSLGEKYDTLIAGFEIEIKAKDFKSVGQTMPTATLILGDTYEKQETEVVTNEVDVYETGIFDSSMVDYQGDGVVVAVLDTGLDYTHTAFSVDNFTTSNEAFTLDKIASKINDTAAATFTFGLTAEDVYINKKVPYAYDYADKDPDVAPINSEHGTHVAGIIAGKDDTITGVAPNAQLAIFKVFSDHSTGAKSSWIIAALEDCVTLGVDVINMSLGSGCGFTRETDKENVNEIYDKVRDAGIELIASAANSYNATMGSTKNGNNGLTSNPDSGTVGSPSTYPGALSVASVEGVKTSYLKIGDTIMYFNEAFTNSADNKKSFVNDMLATLDEEVDTHEFEYAVIPGIGRSSDYPEEDDFYKGKIVLVKRGQTTFEDKVRVALMEKEASGIIIYNNVSGTISMSVGADIGAVCSISQDAGEYLISQIDKTTGLGKITISRDNLAGPFMSDFSSWGPTSDLKIKPEITAHGGQILSSVPGQEYERLSGTSMAAPNLAGAAALICQYVKYSGVFGSDLTANEVTTIVNQLMMSTADIIYDKNGLPSAVRKQGAGLISMSKATTAESYITTYDLDGNKMDKAKLELGDDKNKTGVYEMKFDINNISSGLAKYDIGSIIITEGVSTTYTSHSDTTVTQEAYQLKGAKIEIIGVENGTNNGNIVEVEAGKSATVTVKVTLSDSDKDYLDKSFENGMYVEGFITLTAKDATTVSLNVPMLAFFGDWTQAPIFDEEYYDTHKDEINKGLDDEDKLMADATPTKVIGGLYSDYIATLGTYYFVQDPNATQIAASKDHIAVSNQDKGEHGSTISSIRSVNAGLLRNVKEVYIEIVDDATGEVVYEDKQTNQHKSFSSGSTIYASSIDIEYKTLEHNLKNNTRYTVTLTAYIDYGKNEDQKNVRNVFTFPFYVDFEAPIVTDVVYRTEYDRSSKKTSLFADLYIYDNHYAMGVQIGQITRAEPGSEYTFSMNTFGKYVTPVFSSFNSTSIVTVELTDYIAQLKNSSGIKYNSDGSTEVLENTNTFIASVYDYAMNNATYEIELPDEIKYLYFNEETKKLSPNETLDLSSVLNLYPSSSWIQVLDYSSSDTEVVDIVNNTLIAKKSGTATITAEGKDVDGNKVSTTMEVTVLSPGDEGYVGTYSIPEINKFQLTGYKTIRAYYELNNEDREIGVDGGTYDFGENITLSMFPSEQVKINYVLDSYFPDKTSVQFKSSNSKYVTVSDDGVITAQAKGTTTVTVTVLFDGKSSLYSARVSITVKDPFKIQSIYMMSYRGLGGEVVIPADRGITTIYQYAFSNYKYVDKDLEAGDVIDEEDPYYIKPAAIGDDTVTKVVIPEGVTTIETEAFANMTALEEVVFPSTLYRIGVGAFKNCTSLKKVNLENVKFINEKAFYNCPLENVRFDSTVSIGDYAFENCKLSYVALPACAQSISAGAFYNNEYLTSVTFKANKVKLGSYVFANCTQLSAINVNAAVIPSYAFANCEELTDVTLGSDVSVIGEYAFSGTNVSSFKLNKNNYLTLEADGALVLKGNELLLAAPNYVGPSNTITTNATSIATGAFAGNKKVFTLVANNVKSIGAYAFSGCVNLKNVTMPNVENIGNNAFDRTVIQSLDDTTKLTNIGDYAFFFTNIEHLTINDNATVGKYAFANCQYLKDVTIGNNVTLDEYTFYIIMQLQTYDKTQNFTHYTPYSYEVKDEDGNTIKTNSYYRYNFSDGIFSSLKTVTAGSNLKIGKGAFFGNGKLHTVTLGENAVVGEYAFYGCHELANIDFTNVKSIGDYAFSGFQTQDFWLEENKWNYAYERQYDDGVFVNTAFIYTYFAPCFVSADLSNVESIGKYAFAGNTNLNNVILSDSIDEIGEYTFANCKALETIVLKDHITKVGDYAFYNSGIKTINLNKVDSIGEGAFYNTKVNNITFKDGVKIGEKAFYYVKKLTTVANANMIDTICAYAFTLTGIESIDLSNASLIDDFAFSQSALKNVVLGERLEKLGENPFYGCDITSFGKTIETKHNGVVVETRVEETYDVNDRIKVVNGVLYQTIPTGLELVSYPKLKDQREYTVLDGTTRITAAAFAYSNLESVTLSNVLKAIGDKAFYGCDKLNVVTFTSYTAPLLEEAYNLDYLLYTNTPISGYFAGYQGLGISKYYMWNLTTNYTNFYFGANFKNYVGHITDNLIMVTPKNGQNYDSFILYQYFKTNIDGNFAPTLETLSVIELINNLPTNITLASEEVIKQAREAFASIISTEQQALVDNYTTLVKAESTLAYLKAREEESKPVDPVEPEKPAKENKFGKFMANNAVGFICCGVVMIAFATTVIVMKRKDKKSDSTETKE